VTRLGKQEQFRCILYMLEVVCDAIIVVITVCDVISVGAEFDHVLFDHPKSQPPVFGRQIGGAISLVELDGGFVPVQHGKVASGATNFQPRPYARLPQGLAHPLAAEVGRHVQVLHVDGAALPRRVGPKVQDEARQLLRGLDNALPCSVCRRAIVLCVGQLRHVALVKRLSTVKTPVSDEVVCCQLRSVRHLLVVSQLLNKADDFSDIFFAGFPDRVFQPRRGCG